MTQPAADLSSAMKARGRRFAVLLLSALLVVSAPALAQAPENAGAPAPAGVVAAPAAAGPTAPAAAAPSESTGGAVEPTRLPRDLSPWGMFLAADWVVKAVMIGLVLASVAAWTVWLAKTLELFSMRRQAARDIAALGRARTVTEAAAQFGGRGDPVPQLVRAGLAELEASSDALAGEGIRERVASRLERIEARHGRRATFGTGVLATIGSTAPFVGLFGTVWGIMNSFIGISRSQTTNLVVVAPGIAEALLATALGLVAAIPAVVIYNALARSISAYRALLADAAAEVMRLASRDLDRLAAHDRGALAAAAE